MYSSIFSDHTTLEQPQKGVITLAELDALIDGIRQMVAAEPDMIVVSPVMLKRYEKALRLFHNQMERWQARRHRTERTHTRLQRQRRAMQRKHARERGRKAR